MRRSFRSALPLRAQGRCACCRRARAAGARARGRVRAMSAPAPARLRRLRARREERRHLRWPSARASERARRLACFADGLRVASPVQAAAAARGRARRPPRPRHLRHDRQARRRHHGHEDPAAVTPAGSAAWPGGAKPVPVIRARSSSRLRPRRRTARPAHHRVRPRRLRPGHRRRPPQQAPPRPPRRRRLSPWVHHITASRTTPAHTH